MVTIIEIQTEVPFNPALLEIFGSWKEQNTGPLSCNGSVLTLQDNNKFILDYGDCNPASFFNDTGFWTAKEESFILESNLNFSGLNSKVEYFIESKSNTQMQTYTLDGEFKKYQTWIKQ